MADNKSRDVCSQTSDKCAHIPLDSQLRIPVLGLIIRNEIISPI